MAEKFRPRMILGIDIDGILINKARKLVSTRANELQGFRFTCNFMFR